ncbi:hypothetical protein V8E51_014578 [Hyaloscypha variabilis]
MSFHEHEPRMALHKVRQACDCCRARKIRCDSQKPCDNCQRTQQSCIYRMPKKKGPKRREWLKDAFQTVRERQDVPDIGSPHSSLSGTTRFQSSPLLSAEMMQSCLDAFFLHKYPIMPILGREEISASLHHLDDSPTEYCLITTLCALMTLQTEISLPLSRDGASPGTPKHASMSSSVDFLINETYRARKFRNHIDNPSLADVQASFFLFAVFFSLGRDNSAWFYIRESMTMLQVLRLHEEATYTSMTDPQYATYCRRTFWLLFITERAYALQRHRPLTLRRTISLPTVEAGPEATILSGFLDLVALFRNFGDPFISLWNLSGDSVPSPQLLVGLQDFLTCALPNVSERTEIQQADLLVSRQWLKIIVWQLCLSNGLLSSTSTIECMSFHYPVTIAQHVILVSRLLPHEAFKANGVGILEKIFDIGSSLADVLLVRQIQTSALEIGPRDYLMELVRILATDIEGSSKYLRLLASKAEECLEVGLRGLRLSFNGNSPADSEIDLDEEVNNDDFGYGPLPP